MTRKELKTARSNWAREKAAQAWCKPKTKGIVMIPELAEAFAEILIEEITEAIGVSVNEALDFAVKKKLIKPKKGGKNPL